MFGFFRNKNRKAEAQGFKVYTAAEAAKKAEEERLKKEASKDSK